MKRIFFKSKVLLAALFFCAVLTLSGCKRNASFSLAEQFSISDLECTNMNLTQREKELINENLSKWYYEDTSICGFVANNNTVNFYSSFHAIKTLRLFNDLDTLSSLKDNYRFLETVDVKEYDILNLLYYKYICDTFSFSYNKNNVKEVLMNHFDTQDSLFYLNSEKDDLTLKYALSALVLDISMDLISEKYDEMKDAALQKLEYTVFRKDSSLTLYSSGGGIIYYCNKLGIEMDLLRENIHDWFDYWKNVYENYSDATLGFIISYSEFFKIALIFDSNYSRERIDSFYHSINYDTLFYIDDLQYIYNAVEFCSKLDDTNVNSLVLSKVNYMISNSLFNKRISARSTAFGILMSNFSGFSYNKEKVNNYMKSEYNNLFSCDDEYLLTETLYYLIGLDQMVNGTNDHCYDDYDIQKLVNNSLKSFNYGKDASMQDIVSESYIIEIISAIQSLSGKISLYKSDAKKLKSTIAEGIKNDEIKNSIYFSYLKNIDYRLGFDLIDNAEIENVLNTLFAENGFKLDTTSSVPNIYSTYKFIKCIESYNVVNANELLEKASLNINYSNSCYSFKLDEDGFTVVSMYLANYINNTEHFVNKKD